MKTNVTKKLFIGARSVFTLPTNVVRVKWNPVMTRRRDPRGQIIKTVLKLINQINCANTTMISSFLHIESRLVTELLNHMVQQKYIEEETDETTIENSKEKLAKNREISLDKSEFSRAEDFPFFRLSKTGTYAMSRDIWIREHKLTTLKFPNVLRRELGATGIYSRYSYEIIDEKVNNDRFEFTELMDGREEFGIPSQILNEKPTGFKEVIEKAGSCEILVSKDQVSIITRERKITVSRDHPDVPLIMKSFKNLPDEKKTVEKYFQARLGSDGWSLKEYEGEFSRNWEISIETDDQDRIRQLVKACYELKPDLVESSAPVAIHAPIADTGWRIHFRVQFNTDNNALRDELHYWRLNRILEILEREIDPETVIDRYNNENNCSVDKEQLRSFLAEHGFWDSLNAIQEWEDIVNE